MSSVAHLAFRAMRTDVTITVVGGDQRLLTWAQQRIAELEGLWSRFRPASEISTLNRAGGATLRVSIDTVTAVRTACSAWLLSDGCFDPTVHDALVRLGDDDTIDGARDLVASVAAPPMPAPGCFGVSYDEIDSTVRFPPGVRFDLGGIGKGLAADLTVAGLLERGASGALVSIGGDTRVAGTPAHDGAWTVEIEDPRTERPIGVVELLDGGVSTSTTLRRRWRSNGRTVHHIIEPGTGTNPHSEHGPEVVGVSVVAGTAAWADALSKVPFVDPDRTDCFAPASALLMFADGRSATIGPFALSDVAAGIGDMSRTLVADGAHRS